MLRIHNGKALSLLVLELLLMRDDSVCTFFILKLLNADGNALDCDVRWHDSSGLKAPNIVTEALPILKSLWESINNQPNKKS